jgi:hypothetical protein
VSARQVFLLGTAKQAVALDLLWGEYGQAQRLYPTFGRLLTALGHLMFPEGPDQDPRPLSRARLLRVAGAVRAAIRTFRGGMADTVPATSIDPEASAVRPSSLW